MANATTSTVTPDRAWTSFGNEADQKAFITAVGDIADKRFAGHIFDKSEGTIVIPEKECVVDLSMAARACRGVDQADWRVTLTHYFSRLDEFVPDEVARRLGDYETVKDDLRVRIVSDTMYSNDGSGYLASALPVGLEATLYMVADDAACPVDATFVEQWPAAAEDVLNDALDRTLDAEKWENIKEQANGDWFMLENTESGFASTLLLDTSRPLPSVGDKGAVVTLPTTSHVCVCPVEPVDTFADRVCTMMSTSLIIQDRAPNPNSANAVWWQQGMPLQPFAELEGDSPQLLAPPELRSHIGLNTPTVTAETKTPISAGHYPEIG